MLVLVFLSLGGVLPFLRGRDLPMGRLPALSVLTLVGSTLGALLLRAVPVEVLPAVLATAMLVVVIFVLIQPEAGLSARSAKPSAGLEAAGYGATLLLGVYGGFFSGGYVSLLTAAYVAFFRLTFVEAVAVTKVLNILSSLVATAVFAHQGLIDWNLGLLLSLVSFAGAVVGAVLARRLSNLWLRRIFLTAVVALAFKLLFSGVVRAGF
jgi:uncharacterized membrane protein YfcA